LPYRHVSRPPHERNGAYIWLYKICGTAQYLYNKMDLN